MSRLKRIVVGCGALMLCSLASLVCVWLFLESTPSSPERPSITPAQRAEEPTECPSWSADLPDMKYPQRYLLRLDIECGTPEEVFEEFRAGYPNLDCELVRIGRKKDYITVSVRPEAPTPTGPTPMPTPRPTRSPEDRAQLAANRLRVAIEKALGPCNRPGVDRVSTVSVETGPSPQVFVEWAIDENLTAGLTKSGAQVELADLLDAITKLCKADRFEYGSVRVEGTFSMKDQFGHVEETVVIKAAYKRETLDRIYGAILENWDKMYDVADAVWVHPAFQK